MAAAEYSVDAGLASATMIRAFFEGPAGCGKTHQLIDCAVAASRDLFVDPGQKLLGLTFMNGARHRLNLRFGNVPQLRRRFICLTFDSFAGLVTHRQRARLRGLPAGDPDGELNVFDRSCVNAARLLELPDVAAWVAASHPLVVVDEAQDLNPYRFRMLRALAGACCVLGAADEFQNLSDNGNAGAVIDWLRTADTPITLNQIRRTTQDGILCVASALRDGRAVCAELTTQREFLPCHVGAGFRMVQPHGKPATAAWAVADELNRMSDNAVILTPDASSPLIRQVIGKVENQAFNKNRGAVTLGPFPLRWERADEDEASVLINAVPSDGALPLKALSATIASLGSRYGRDICGRLDRIRNVRGQATLERDELRDVVVDVVRNSARFGSREGGGRRIMTIQRAKNREFRHVVVLWPQTVRGTAEQQRRLLYNAVTRAQERCAVVVFGRNRIDAAPFA
jgi:hypothetical protein